MAIPSDDYDVGRSVHESVRLNGQHFIWNLQSGYILHPHIPIQENMRILDIGTGTGVWLLELAEHLPSTAQLHGVDISSNQFPPNHCVPNNVSFSILDILGNSVPADMIGTYDVIHMRLLAVIVHANNPTQMIKNAIALLKPTGYIQWEELSMRTLGHGSAAEAFMQAYEAALALFNIHLGWLHKIPQFLKLGGIHMVDYQNRPFSRVTEALQTANFLVSLEGIVKELRQRDLDEQGRKTVDRLGERHRELCQLMQRQHIIPFTAMCLLAQKA